MQTERTILHSVLTCHAHSDLNGDLVYEHNGVGKCQVTHCETEAETKQDAEVHCCGVKRGKLVYRAYGIGRYDTTHTQFSFNEDDEHEAWAIMMLSGINSEAGA